MAGLSTVRIIVFLSAILFAIITIGLASTGLGHGELALSLLAGILTIVLLPVYMVIDIKRNGAHTSFIFVELLTLGILWILWLAASAAIAKLERDCAGNFYCKYDGNLRHVRPPEAFAFLSFLNLFIYWSMLVILTLIAQSHGHKPWKGSVKYTEFLAPRLPPKEPIADLAVERQLESNIPSARNANLTVLHHNRDPSVYPGFPEPQSAGLRNIDSMASMNSGFPSNRDPSSWTPSPPMHPDSLPPPNVGPLPIPSGLPEPHVVISSTPGRVDTSVDNAVPAKGLSSSNSSSSGLPSFQADTLYRFASLIEPLNDRPVHPGSLELDAARRGTPETKRQPATETAPLFPPPIL